MRARTLVSPYVVAVGLSVFAARPAYAQSAAAAETLFKKGHDLFEAKRFAEACPLFAESYRMDPQSGALLALASCHEAEGKLATAWGEYGDAAARYQREGRADRVDAIRQRATALEAKLARVTIAISAEAASIPGLVVKRDGVVVGAATFGTALPVDRGEHVIEASAPGRTAYTQRPSIQDGTNITVTIPVLAVQKDVTAAVVVPPATTTPAPTANDTPPASDGSTLRTVGVVVGVTGIVAMGVGGYFGLSAISKNSDSKGSGGCNENACNDAGTATRNDARTAGDISTALFVVGGALVAGGIVLYVVGSSSGSDSGKPRSAIAPSVGRDSAGLSLSGSF